MRHVLHITETSYPVAKPDGTSQKAGPKIKKAECKIKYKKFSLSSSYVWDQHFSNSKFRLVLKFHFSWNLNSSGAHWQR